MAKLCSSIREPPLHFSSDQHNDPPIQEGGRITRVRAATCLNPHGWVLRITVSASFILTINGNIRGSEEAHSLYASSELEPTTPLNAQRYAHSTQLRNGSETLPMFLLAFLVIVFRAFIIPQEKEHEDLETQPTTRRHHHLNCRG